MLVDIVQKVPTGSAADQVLEQTFRVHKLWQAADPAAFFAELAPRARGLVTTGGAGADAALLDALPNLEVVACFGVGVDAIDTRHCERRGIRVSNTPDVLTEDVADLALALTLAVLRRLPQGDAFVRQGRWPTAKFPLAETATGKRAGIIGMGRIGRAIARRLEACCMTVAYTGPRPKADVASPYVASVQALARDVDVLVVACPGGEATRHLVNAPVLEALGPKGILINIARGSVVDEAALVAALQARRLGGAGLDVFADEPRTPPELWAMDNVVLQPHVGSATTQTRNAMGDLVVQNLLAHFSGQPMPSRYI